MAAATLRARSNSLDCAREEAMLLSACAFTAVTSIRFNPGLSVSSPQHLCTLAPPVEIGEIAKCPQQFNVVVHTQTKPAGAIRGQLGTTCVL